MFKKVKAIDVFFSALNSGLILGAFCGLFFAAVLSALYSKNFPELTFPKLVASLSGSLVFLTASLSLIAGVLVIVLRVLFRRAELVKKQFAFFISAGLVLHFWFWMVLYLNSVILRYSRETKSYLVDLAVVAAGLILFVSLYKILPSWSLTMKRWGLRSVSLLLFLISVAIALTLNPFSQSAFLPQERIGVKRNYDSNGKYLGQIDNQSAKPNVILFSIDTLRSDGPSCFGNPRKTTPVLDQLAQEGIVFRNTVAQSSWTLPSHMTMITSLMPSVHGCKSSQLWIRIGEALSENRVTLAEILKNFGYTTAGFTGGALVGKPYNFDQGFDVFDNAGGGIAKISQKALDWLSGKESANPFFLFLHCYDVHSYKASPEIEAQFVRPYSGKLLELKKAGRPLEVRVTSNAFYSLSEPDIRFLRDLYDATIFQTDRVFGELINFLKEREIYDNTIIIVTSDHGEEFWEHGGTGHGWSLHEHQLKVPLIIKSPTFDHQGREIDEWAGIIDLAPTICDMLGIPLSNEFQGISLLPLINGDPYGERVFIAEATHSGHQKSLIRNGYSFLFNQFPPLGEKLFYWRRFIRTWRIIMQYTDNKLYHLATDAREEHDILSENPRLEEEMSSFLIGRIKKLLALNAAGASADEFALDKKTKEELESLGYIK